MTGEERHITATLPLAFDDFAALMNLAQKIADRDNTALTMENVSCYPSSGSPNNTLSIRWTAAAPPVREAQ